MKRKGIIFGSFDVWHAGYALMVEDAKKYCDYLIVGLQTDNPTKNIITPLHERFLILKSIKHIDEVAIYTTEEELANLLDFYKPNCRLLGSDYEDRDKFNNISARFKSGEIIFLNRDHGYSTTKFKERIVNESAQYSKQINYG